MNKLKASVKYAGAAVLFVILMTFNLSVGLNEKLAEHGGLSLQSLAARIFVPTANAYEDKGGGTGLPPCTLQTGQCTPQFLVPGCPGQECYFWFCEWVPYGYGQFISLCHYTCNDYYDPWAPCIG